MKFKDFLALSSKDEDIQDFRMLKFKLVEEDTKHSATVEKISKLFDLDDNLFSLLESLNKELKRIYRGKYKFDFCIEEGVKGSEIKTSENRILSIKEKELQFNAELSKIKSNFEKKL